MCQTIVNLVVRNYCHGHVVEMFKLSCDTIILLQISFLVFCDDEFIIHFVMMRLDVDKAIKDAKKPSKMPKNPSEG